MSSAFDSKEIWAFLPEYMRFSAYAFSSKVRVNSYRTNRFINDALNAAGYRTLAMIDDNGIIINRQVSRMVLAAFFSVDY